MAKRLALFSSTKINTVVIFPRVSTTTPWLPTTRCKPALAGTQRRRRDGEAGQACLFGLTC